MNALPPLVNGKAHEWADIQLILFGTPVAGITAISYKEKQEMENNYGAGNRPVSRGHGNITYDASITLLAEEVEAIAAQAPNKRLQEIPEFDIVIAFLPDGGVPVTHTLKMCRFTERGVDAKQGDKKIEVSIPLIVGDMKF